MDMNKLRGRLLFAAKLAVFALVIVGIGHQVWKSLGKFEEQQFSLADVHYGWMLLSGAFYLLGMAPSWVFWHLTLRAMGQHPTLWESFRAFYLSQLGKYVPGKALVVVLRTNWVRGPRVDTTIAATTVFVETLTLMAVGALLAAAILAAAFREQRWLLVLAIGLMLCSGVPTLPPIFRRIVHLLQVRRANAHIDKALEGLNFRLMITGWVIVSCGWCFYGLSLWATLRAMPATHVDLWDMPLLTACVALAMVAGFLSLIPGGAGVRELVIMTLLAPVPGIGPVSAIISAVLLRFSWLLSEVAISIILYLASRRHR